MPTNAELHQSINIVAERQAEHENAANEAMVILVQRIAELEKSNAELRGKTAHLESKVGRLLKGVDQATLDNIAAKLQLHQGHIAKLDDRKNDLTRRVNQLSERLVQLERSSAAAAIEETFAPASWERRLETLSNAVATLSAHLGDLENERIRRIEQRLGVLEQHDRSDHHAITELRDKLADTLAVCVGLKQDYDPGKNAVPGAIHKDDNDCDAKTAAEDQFNKGSCLQDYHLAIKVLDHKEGDPPVTVNQYQHPLAWKLAGKLYLIREDHQALKRLKARVKDLEKAVDQAHDLLQKVAIPF